MLDYDVCPASVLHTYVVGLRLAVYGTLVQCCEPVHDYCDRYASWRVIGRDRRGIKLHFRSLTAAHGLHQPTIFDDSDKGGVSKICCIDGVTFRLSTYYVRYHCGWCGAVLESTTRRNYPIDRKALDQVHHFERIHSPYQRQH